MQQHIEQLCHEYDIRWKPWLKRSDKAYAISLEDSGLWDIREILTAPIRSTMNCDRAARNRALSWPLSAPQVPNGHARSVGVGMGAAERACLDARNGTVRDQRGRSLQSARTR